MTYAGPRITHRVAAGIPLPRQDQHRQDEKRGEPRRRPDVAVEGGRLAAEDFTHEGTLPERERAGSKSGVIVTVGGGKLVPKLGGGSTVSDGEWKTRHDVARLILAGDTFWTARQANDRSWNAGAKVDVHIATDPDTSTADNLENLPTAA